MKAQNGKFYVPHTVCILTVNTAIKKRTW